MILAWSEPFNCQNFHKFTSMISNSTQHVFLIQYLLLIIKSYALSELLVQRDHNSKESANFGNLLQMLYLDHNTKVYNYTDILLSVCYSC